MDISTAKKLDALISWAVISVIFAVSIAVYLDFVEAPLARLIVIWYFLCTSTGCVYVAFKSKYVLGFAITLNSHPFIFWASQALHVFIVALSTFVLLINET
jgi:hypothetical protein